MRVAITSTGKALSSDSDPRFGRAAYFIIVDPETMEYDVVENSQNLDLPHGAGIQAGKTIVDNKVFVVITGNCGPNAFKVLQSAGIKIAIGAKGLVSDVIAQYKKGELEIIKDANVEGHWV
ncbi:MAG: NifB/NifX family molybdenum-iron cluster-binding protein [Thermodesulfobacteriota bacterium]|nr:NifB/NifX family molybdenum-iron cluster-binding protein [Thermodesulfobacteriota bacterium]